MSNKTITLSDDLYEFKALCDGISKTELRYPDTNHLPMPVMTGRPAAFSFWGLKVL